MSEPNSKRVISYTPSPTMLRFHQDDARFRGIMGPYGSGKTVGCCMELLRRARMQTPLDGVRRTRWAFIRNTYSQLKSTTIRTWQDWVPNSICPLVYDAPIRGRFVAKQPDGTTVDMEVWFFALDRPDHINKIGSLEITGFFVNEARTIPKRLIDALLKRCGRYPKKDNALGFPGATWYGGIADSNPPDEKHWWHRLAETQPEPGWNFYRQPGGLVRKQRKGKTIYLPNPAAENIENLLGGYNYYLDGISGLEPEFIKVHILGEYGNTFTGRAVYEDVWNDHVHVSDTPLPIFPGPLYLGWDYGVPACVVVQPTPTGHLHCLREYTAKHSQGIRQFARDVVIPALQYEFPKHPIPAMLCTGDPAGTQRAQADSDITPQGILASLGFGIEAAPVNLFPPRREAVLDFLTRMIDGKPVFLLDKRCEMLRAGFNGGYMYSRIQVTEERFKDRPEKNEYSHPHDALQYACLRLRPGAEKLKPAIPLRTTDWAAFA